MNPSEIKQDIDDLLDIVRQEAEARQERAAAQRRLFIFAVEIGRRKKLTPEQRVQYEKTYETAYVLAGMADRTDPHSSFDLIADESLKDWLDLEPKARTWLENVLGSDFSALSQPQKMPRETRQMIMDNLSELYGDGITKAEIEGIIDRIEFPLDRA